MGNINIDYNNIENIINIIKEKFNAIANCNLSYKNSLSGELLAYYNSLGDNTENLFEKLKGLMSALTLMLASNLESCKQSDDENLHELQRLIDELYGVSGDILISNTDVSKDEFISYEDYLYLFNNMDEIFEERYQEIINKFKMNVSIGYQKFLEQTVPSTINNIIENTYIKNSDKLGKDGYSEELKKIKNSFGKNILNKYNINNFNIEESNIPKYLWENADDYQKSLLMLSYNNEEFKGNYGDNLKSEINKAFEENNIIIKDLGTFDYDITSVVDGFSAVNEYLCKDYDKELAGLSIKEKIKRIEEITNKIKEPLNFSRDSVSKYTMEDVLFPNISNIPQDKCWLESIKELGYLDNIDKEYSQNDLYNNTFNYEFLTNIAVNEGTDKVYSIILKYYDKCFKESGYQNSGEEAEKLARRLFQETMFVGNFTTANMTLKALNNIDEAYNGLIKDKITLDAAKANYKLGLLENIDTSDIAENDIEKAKKIIGNDAKYLEDWQIKGYYKIYLENKELGNKILNDTLYNIIQDGKGRDKAKSVYSLMTGEEQKKLLNQIIHNEIFNDIWGKTSGFIYTAGQGFVDGVGNSIRNVGDLFLADGKMDANDYYLSYLQEYLSSGGVHNVLLKLDYNVSNSVGNMAIPMALSAFVLPHAMSAWIFAAETGSSREQALRSGAENDALTFLNAAAKGIVAVGVEKTLGALKGYGGKSDDLLKIFTSDKEYITKLMGTNLGKKLAYGISNSVNETIEELVENAGGYGIDFITGRDIDLGGIPKETWETIYMTMLTTPLINMMGGSFQNSKNNLINRKNIYHLDGFDIECSKAELMKFTDNQGHVDNKELFNYLLENERISSINEEELYKNVSLNDFMKNGAPNFDDVEAKGINCSFDEFIERVIKLDKLGLSDEESIVYDYLYRNRMKSTNIDNTFDVPHPSTMTDTDARNKAYEISTKLAQFMPIGAQIYQIGFLDNGQMYVTIDNGNLYTVNISEKSISDVKNGLLNSNMVKDLNYKNFLNWIDVASRDGKDGALKIKKYIDSGAFDAINEELQKVLSKIDRSQLSSLYDTYIEKKQDFSPEDCIRLLNAKKYNGLEIIEKYIKTGNISRDVDQRTLVTLHSSLSNVPVSDIIAAYNKVTTGQKISTDFVGNIPTIATKGESILRKKILFEAGKHTDMLAKMKSVYLTMGKSLSYDPSFIYDKDRAMQLKDFYQSTSFDLLGKNDKIICSSWSALFKEALIDIGVDPTKIRVQNIVSAESDFGHKWVEVDLSDIKPGYVLIADSTDGYQDYKNAEYRPNDLNRIVYNVPVLGFMVVPENCSGKRLANSIRSFDKIDIYGNIIKNSNDINKDIDKIIRNDLEDDNSKDINKLSDKTDLENTAEILVIDDDLEDTQEIPIVNDKQNSEDGLEDTMEIPVIDENSKNSNLPGNDLEDTQEMPVVNDKQNNEDGLEDTMEIPVIDENSKNSNLPGNDLEDTQEMPTVNNS